MELYNYSGSLMLDYKHDWPIGKWKGWQFVSGKLQSFIDNMCIDWDEDHIRGDAWEIYSDNIFNIYVAGLPYLKYADVEAELAQIEEKLIFEENTCYQVFIKHWDIRYLHFSANSRNKLKLFKLMLIFDVKTKRRPLTKREAQLERQLDY